MRLGHVRKFVSLPPVEVDEVYIGGLDSNRHAWQVKEGHGPKRKAAVVGMKDDDTDMVTTEVVETTDKEMLQGFVEVNTDGNTPYATSENRTNRIPNPLAYTAHILVQTTKLT